MSRSLNTFFEYETINRNLRGLKTNLHGLGFFHTKEVTDYLHKRVSHAFVRVNALVLKANDWAESKIQQYQDCLKDQKELEQQISVMEGEGNMPGGYVS